MNDLNLEQGNWTLANLSMESALLFARYDYRFEMGTGGHDLAHGGPIFPDTLRWIWRDYPGVKGADAAPSLDAVIGQWDVTTNILGEVGHSVLTIAAQEDVLVATLIDDRDGEIEVSAISLDDGILSYEYEAPPSQMSWAQVKGDDTSSRTLITWLNVTGDTFKGAMSGEEKALDYAVYGKRRSRATEAD